MTGKSWCYLMLYVPNEIQYTDRFQTITAKYSICDNIQTRIKDDNEFNNEINTLCEGKMDGKTIMETIVSKKDIYDEKIDLNTCGDVIVAAKDKADLEVTVEDVIR